jgi:hypothetical protein
VRHADVSARPAIGKAKRVIDHANLPERSANLPEKPAPA